MMRLLPQPDALVEIDIPAAAGAARHTVTRRIATIRDHGDGRYTCLLSDPATGALSTATIAPATEGQWLCIQPPLCVDGAVHLARSVLAGIALHRPVNEQLHALADAVLFLTGQHRPAGPCAPARLGGTSS